MNIETIKKSIPYCNKHNICPLLIGLHGVGKSSAVRQYTEEQGIGFIDLRLGQMETGDLLGLPDIVTDENGHRVTVFARPKWFPTEGRGVLFLDEINRAKRDVLQAIFQLVLDRKIHDYTLPEGWQVVAAQNPSTEDYMVTEFDRALNDRFCHIKVTSSYKDFLEYGNTKGLNKTVMNFISNQPGMLRGATKDFNLAYVTPSDRSMEQVCRLMDDKEIPDDILNELVAGLVGLEAATALMAFRQTAEKPIEGAVILANYKKVQKTIQAQCDSKNYRPDLVNDTKGQVISIIQQRKAVEDFSDVEYKNLTAFMLDMPNDLFTDMVNQLVKIPNKLFLKLADDADLMDKANQCLAEKESKEAKVEEVTEDVTSTKKKAKKK